MFTKYTFKMRKAIRFATKVHEVDQKQKRKGKDIAYIAHPLTVALILSQVDASEEVIIAGLLHDTVEDCSTKHPVTLDNITKEFNKEISTLVQSVTEEDGDLPWAERKQQAREHVKDFSHDMLLLKSADILSNGTEIVDDYKVDGDTIFERFNAPKMEKIESQLRLISTIITQWEDNPLAMDLRLLANDFVDMGGIQFIRKHKAQKIEMNDYDEEKILQCPACLWKGTATEKETYDSLFEIICPVCLKSILIVSYASTEETPSESEPQEMSISGRANFASYMRHNHNTPTIPEKEIYTDEEISHKLAISTEQVHKYIQVEVLKASKNKDGYDIQSKDYDTFLEKYGNKISKQFHSAS